MTPDTRPTLRIERTICVIAAIIGAMLLWVSMTQAAVVSAPAFQDLMPSTSAATVTPEPATLVMFTSGILCVAAKMLRGGV